MGGVCRFRLPKIGVCVHRLQLISSFLISPSSSWSSCGVREVGAEAYILTHKHTHLGAIRSNMEDLIQTIFVMKPWPHILFHLDSRHTTSIFHSKIKVDVRVQEIDWHTWLWLELSSKKSKQKPRHLTWDTVSSNSVVSSLSVSNKVTLVCWREPLTLSYLLWPSQ